MCLRVKVCVNAVVCLIKSECVSASTSVFVLPNHLSPFAACQLLSSARSPFRYVNQKFTQAYRATIGVDFLAKDITLNDKYMTLQIWDTAGQEKFQSLNGAFYQGADCCVLVFDLTNKKSFESLEQWKNEFRNQKATTQDNRNVPIVILANKSDK